MRGRALIARRFLAYRESGASLRLFNLSTTAQFGASAVAGNTDRHVVRCPSRQRGEIHVSDRAGRRISPVTSVNLSERNRPGEDRATTIAFKALPRIGRVTVHSIEGTVTIRIGVWVGVTACLTCRSAILANILPLRDTLRSSDGNDPSTVIELRNNQIVVSAV